MLRLYGAAADRQQASIVFDVAKQMVEMSPALMKRSKLMGATKRIVNYSNTYLKLDDAREEVEKLAKKQAEAENEFWQLGMKEDKIKFKKMG